MKKMNFVCLRICLFLSLFSVRTITTTRQTELKDGMTIMRNSNGASIFLHSRQKRYLLFLKGASVGMQTNFAKAVISERPRGLNEITEYTLTYDLPYMLSHNRPKPIRTTIAPATTTVEIPFSPEQWQWSTWSEAQRRHYKVPKKTSLSSSAHPSSSLNCQPMSFQNAIMQSQPTRLYMCSSSETRRPTQQSPTQTQSKRRYKRKVAPHSHMLFDLLTLWARIHAFNGRHCIMRTLCEVTQTLRPAGESLFHDLLRLLLLSALPAVEQHGPFANAWRRRNGPAHDCERLYGPHCRLSFLQQLDATFASMQ